MALTDRIDVFTNAVYELLVTNKNSLGLADVWYGDQNKTPATPCAAVESGQKTREYNGIPRRTAVVFIVYILLYLERVQDIQLNRKQSEALAEDIEAVLHADATFGGLVIDSLVNRSEPGYANRGGQLVSAVRLTLSGTSQVQLPYPGS